MAIEDKPKKRTKKEKKAAGMRDPLADLTTSSIKKPGLKELDSTKIVRNDDMFLSKGLLDKELGTRSPYAEMSGKTGSYQYRPHGKGGYEVLKDKNIKFYEGDSIGAKQVRDDERRWKEKTTSGNKLITSLIKDPSTRGVLAHKRKIKEDDDLVAKEPISE